MINITLPDGAKQKYDDDVYHPINATVNNIHDIISTILVKETSTVFDYKDWDKSLVEIEQKMRDVIIANEELFMVSGELQFIKGYEIYERKNA